MKKHMSRKPGKGRGAGRIERSKSGGAVRGRIPKPGGFNSTNHMTGVTMMKHGTSSVKKAPKNAR